MRFHRIACAWARDEHIQDITKDGGIERSNFSLTDDCNSEEMQNLQPHSLDDDGPRGQHSPQPANNLVVVEDGARGAWGAGNTVDNENLDNSRFFEIDDDEALIGRGGRTPQSADNSATAEGGACGNARA
eukprot:scaffold285113_cov22-Tisochrysis_lutea.AAC.1